jgi:hypothetical protein
MQRIQVFQIPNQHFNKLSATKSYEYIPDDDELSDSATIYDSDGKKVLQESTDLTLRATVLPSMTLMGWSWKNIPTLTLTLKVRVLCWMRDMSSMVRTMIPYQILSVMAIIGMTRIFGMVKMSQDLRKKYVFPQGMELTCTKEN